MKINQTKLAQDVVLNATSTNGGAASTANLAQTREIVRLTLEQLHTYPASAVMELVERVGHKAFDDIPKTGPQRGRG